MFQMRKALKLRSERLKTLDPSLHMKAYQNLNLKSLTKGQREILEKGLMEEWTVEGSSKNLTSILDSARSQEK